MAGKPGRSGRRPKRERFAALYEATERDLHGLLEDVAPALRELIRGVFVEENGPNGSTRVYQKAPNVEAIKLLLNRTMGETTKRIEVDALIRTEAQRLAEELGLDADAIVAEAVDLIARGS